MADLIQELERLDRRRAETYYYGGKARALGLIAPGLAGKIIAGLDQRFQDLTRQREQVLQLIWADPVLRLKMREREKATIEEAHRRDLAAEMRGKLPGKLFKPSLALKQIGIKVVGLEQEEARRKDHYEEAWFYYKSSAWERDRVPIAKLDNLLADLKVKWDAVREARGRVTDGLHFNLEGEVGRRSKESLTLLQESLLHEVRSEILPRERDLQTPLSEFLEKERPKRDPVKTPEKDREPSR